jgi:hypothetical protein
MYTVFEAVVCLDQLGSSGANFTALLGFNKNQFVPTLTPTDALNITYNYATNGGHWTLNATSGSTTTSSDMGAGPAGTGSNSYQRIGFIMNSAGTSVQGIINGVAAGSPITTNIPSSSISGGLIVYMISSAGSNDNVLSLDAIKFLMVGLGR